VNKAYRGYFHNLIAFSAVNSPDETSVSDFRFSQRLLRCDAVSLGQWLPTFRRSVMPSCSGSRGLGGTIFLGRTGTTDLPKHRSPGDLSQKDVGVTSWQNGELLTVRLYAK
jgi:hypothetical protein